MIEAAHVGPRSLARVARGEPRRARCVKVDGVEYILVDEDAILGVIA